MPPASAFPFGVTFSTIGLATIFAFGVFTSAIGVPLTGEKAIFFGGNLTGKKVVELTIDFRLMENMSEVGAVFDSTIEL